MPRLEISWLAMLTVPPGVAVALGALALFYLAGALRLYRARRKHSRPPTRLMWRHLAFLGALVCLCVALSSWLDPLADSYFSMHMVQHMLLVAFAAPLLAASRTWRMIEAAIAPHTLREARRLARRAAPTIVAMTTRVTASPSVAYWLFTGTLWAWHAPAAYDLTLHNQAVHDLEHLSLLVTGVMFWSKALGVPAHGNRMQPAQRAAYLVAGMAQMMVLALVVAFVLPPYAPYLASSTARAQLSAVADQRLAAVVMLIMGGLPMIAASAWCLAQWVIAAPSYRTSAGRGR